LLGDLEKISAADASRRPMPGKTTIASHVDHIYFGLTLLNRWVGGEENPWADADWTASWKRTTVSEEQWNALRSELRLAAQQWELAVMTRHRWDDLSASGAISSVAHTAYHLGEIRQILAAMNL